MAPVPMDMIQICQIIVIVKYSINYINILKGVSEIMESSSLTKRFSQTARESLSKCSVCKEHLSLLFDRRLVCCGCCQSVCARCANYDTHTGVWLCVECTRYTHSR